MHDYRGAGVSSTMVVRWSPCQKVQPVEGHHAKGALTGQPKHNEHDELCSTANG